MCISSEYDRFKYCIGPPGPDIRDVTIKPGKRLPQIDRDSLYFITEVLVLLASV